jgi:5-methylcytosine-specific restriction protein A
VRRISRPRPLESRSRAARSALQQRRSLPGSESRGRTAEHEDASRAAKEREYQQQLALEAWRAEQTYEAKRKAFNRDEERRSRIKLRDNFTCQECRSRMRLTVDHIIPLSLGGSNDESNLRCLCRSCNSRKGALDEA